MSMFNRILPKSKNTPAVNDLGLGVNLTEDINRFVNPDGSFNVIRKGKASRNLYQSLIGMSWPMFSLITISSIIIINLVFGSLLAFTNIGGAPLDISFAEKCLHGFFLSVQTFTTLGYGVLHPNSLVSSALTSVISLLGLLFVALVTGLLFARFSKPKVVIKFSSIAVITAYQDITGFMIRIVNSRNHNIHDLTATLAMSWLSKDQQGQVKRMFQELPLERDHVNLFPLNWTIVHPITKESPLYGKSREDLDSMHAELMVIVKGHDESYNQTIYANSSYTCKEIRRDKKFSMMYQPVPGKGIEIDLDKLNDLE